MRRVWQIAAVYVGSVIGAGFSSGQELQFFFARHGAPGFVAFAVAVAVFFIGGMLVLDRAQRYQTVSHSELLHKLLGPFASGVVDYALTFIAFIVLAIMLAAAGTLGHTLYNVPFSLGVWAMAIVSREILRGDTERFLRFNGLLVVILVGLTCYVVLPLITWPSLTTGTRGDGSYRWLVAGALYAAYNIALALPPLAAVGPQMTNTRQAYTGAALGAFCLGLIGTLLLLALAGNEGAMTSELPIVALAAARSTWGAARIYGVALLLATLTSCVSGAYGIGRRLQRLGDMANRPHSRTGSDDASTALLPLMAAPLSYVGFAKLVQNVYPIVGYMGLFILITAGTKAVIQRISGKINGG